VDEFLVLWLQFKITCHVSGADPGFQARGPHLKNCAEWREARKLLGYFLWKITILRQKIISFSIAKEARKCFGYFVWKITIFLRQKILFFPFLGGCAPGASPPPWTPPLCLFYFLLRHPFLCSFTYLLLKMNLRM
jgi:hypothetical protein